MELKLTVGFCRYGLRIFLDIKRAGKLQVCRLLACAFGALMMSILFFALDDYSSAIKYDAHIFIWLFTVRTPQVILLAGEAGGIKIASVIIPLWIFPKLVML